ncbi:MAG: acetolactate synthase small subunit [Bacteroidetes bacterium]|nr:acetolactate synthase small subunit [Bacteroidota bacterium]
MNNYAISVFTENQIGIINRLACIFTRRRLHINSITASPSEEEGVFRFTVFVRANEQMIHNVITQIQKQIDVLNTSCQQENEVLQQEIALYKLGLRSAAFHDLDKIIRRHHSRILSVTEQFIVIEKTGTTDETHALFKDLEQYGILEFSRSGSITVTLSGTTSALDVNETSQPQEAEVLN